MTFNILSKKLEATATITLKDPETSLELYADEEETKPLTVTVYGRASKPFQNHLAKTMRKLQRQGNKSKDKDLDEVFAENAEYLADMTVKIENFSYGDVELNNREAYKQLYSDRSLAWIADQVTAALQEDGNFLQK